MESGFAALLRCSWIELWVHLYDETFAKFPQGFILTQKLLQRLVLEVTFPVVQEMKQYDFQSSSYDLEACKLVLMYRMKILCAVALGVVNGSV
jgi:beta-galactosidase